MCPKFEAIRRRSLSFNRYAQHHFNLRGNFRHRFHDPFGCQLGKVGIGKSHEDMQMLRIGYIQGKTKNTHDMKPPCRSFNDNQRTGKVSIKDWDKP